MKLALAMPRLRQIDWLLIGLAALFVTLIGLSIGAYRSMPEEWKEGRVSCLYRDGSGALQLRC